MIKVGVLGGSFDPVHRGHIAIAESALSQLSLDEIRLMPCFKPPHKEGFGATDQQRLDMLQLALNNRHKMVLDTRELHADRVSFSVLSMRDLRKSLGDDAVICFVMGWDAWQSLPAWWHWESLFDLVNVVVARRPTYDGINNSALQLQCDLRQVAISELTQSPCGKIAFLENGELDISSSGIRQAFKKNTLLDIKQFENTLDASVIAYIKQQRIY